MRRVPAFVVAVLLGVVGFGAEAGGEPPDASAWWWKAQVSLLVPVPKPPTVPDGGLYVAGEPTGPFGLSAVRLVVPADATIGALTLRIASAQGTVAVVACPTEVAWQAEQGGPITSAPPYSCTSGSVPGVVDAPSNTVSFEVSPLVRDNMLNVVLVPAPQTVFQVAFEKPGDDAVTVTTASSGPGGDDTFVPPDYSYLQGPAFTDTVSVPDGGFPVPSVTTPTSAAPARTPTTAVRRQPGLVGRPKLAAKAKRDPDRVAAALVLILLTGVFMWVANRPDRMPRLVGPMGVLSGGGRRVAHADSAVVPRGVGRFRRPRTGPTPRL